MWQNSQIQNSKTQNVQNSKTQNVTKLNNSQCDKRLTVTKMKKNALNVTIIIKKNKNKNDKIIKKNCNKNH